MDKHLLEQYEDIKKEYEDTKERLRKTQCDLSKYDSKYKVRDSVTGGMGGNQHFIVEGFPYPEYTKKKTLLMRRKLRLEQLEKKLEDAINEVEQYIDAIEEPRKRLILRYRYIDGMTWRQVAIKLGPGNSEDGIRKEVDRFIKKHREKT